MWLLIGDKNGSPGMHPGFAAEIPGLLLPLTTEGLLSDLADVPSDPSSGDEAGSKFTLGPQISGASHGGINEELPSTRYWQ